MLKINMLQSILVYSITAYILYLLAKNAYSREKLMLLGKSNSFLTYRGSGTFTIEYAVSILFFVLISALRYNVGVDHLSYLQEYISFQETGYTLRETFEPMFQFILEFCGYLGLHFTFFFAILAFLQITPIYYAFKNRKYLIPYIVLYIMLGPFYLDFMNGIRQYIICCFFILFVKLILDKKPIKFIIFVVIASYMHKSAFMMLPLYFIGQLKLLWKNKYLYYIILALCIMIGNSPSWLQVNDSLATMVKLFNYDVYSENLDLLTEKADLENSTWGPAKILFLLVNCIIIWFYSSFRKFYKEDKYLDIYFTFFFIGVCLGYLFGHTSDIFLRPIYYLSVFKIPLFAYCLYYLRCNKMHFSFVLLSFSGFSYIYYIIFKLTYITNPLNECYLYKFYFDYY